MRKLGVGALVAGLVVAVLSALAAGSPALAKGKHGPVRWGALSCAYSGRALTQVKVDPPHASMDKKLAKAGGRSQYVGMRVQLQGLRAGRWAKVVQRPKKHDYAVTVRVHPRKKTSLKHAKLLTFKGSALPSAYSSFRVKVTLQWYAYNGHTVRGSLSRTSTACVRTKPAPPPHVVSIESGDGSACALMSNQTMRCWGAGSWGRLGVGSTSDHHTPVTPTGLGRVVAMATGYATACAVTTARTLTCWGLNASGQVGDGTTTSRTIPVTVPGLAKVESVYFDQGATCAVLNPGAALRCWGIDSTGQVGDSGRTNVVRPGATVQSAVVSVGVGAAQTCAVNNSATVACWGSNDHGQIGRTHDTAIHGPTTVASLTGASAVASGSNHNCAVVAGGAVKCWGAGTAYQLGNGSASDSAAPVAAVGLGSEVSALSAEGNTTCAVKAGSVYCWGANGYGQLGNGSTDINRDPAKVAGISHAVGVAVGARSAYAWDAAGHVWAWGDNSYGELATGDTTRHLTPVAVSIH